MVLKRINMNRAKQCCFTVLLALLTVSQAVQSGDQLEYMQNMTTEELGNYLEKNLDKKAQKIKSTCPIPYNAIIDAKNSFLFGGPLGLGVYIASKSIICILKKSGCCQTDEIGTMKEIGKTIHNTAFNTISGGHRTPGQIRNISFHQRTFFEHVATGLFWLLKRLYVSGMVLGTTWLLHKYVIPQAIKDKLALYDYNFTDPIFRLIAKCKLWRLAHNPITR
jgi:hypothetical protein